MTIPFSCPYCQTETEVFDEYAGQSGPCAVCGRLITVPYPSTATSAASPSEVAETPATSHRPRRGLGVPVLTVVAVCAAALIAVSVSLVLMFAFLFPAVRNARVVATKTQSAANLQKILAAMQKYEQRHGSFPPAYLADENGKPKHSWRVLILPELGYQHVFDNYDFSQPWDSPTNEYVRRMMPAEYASNADPEALAQFETSYMVVVGKDTMFPPGGSTRSQDVVDLPADTIVIAETPVTGASWMAPVDFDSQFMQFEINGRDGIEIGSKHPGGAHVVTLDGTPHFLIDEAPPELIRAMTTINGGEVIPWTLAE